MSTSENNHLLLCTIIVMLVLMTISNWADDHVERKRYEDVKQRLNRIEILFPAKE